MSFGESGANDGLRAWLGVASAAVGLLVGVAMSFSQELLQCEDSLDAIFCDSDVPLDWQVGIALVFGMLAVALFLVMAPRLRGKGAYLVPMAGAMVFLVGGGVAYAYRVRPINCPEGSACVLLPYQGDPDVVSIAGSVASVGLLAVGVGALLLLARRVRVHDPT